MEKRLILIAAVALAGCSSSGASTPGHDAGERDVALITFPDTGAHDAPHETAARDAGHPDAAHEAAVDAGRDVVTTDVYPAPHPAMPQVVNAGGPVMKAPKFVVITFAGDTLESSIVDFSQKVAASATYWSGTTAEYGVGPVASVQSIVVNETPAASLEDSDVQAWLAAKINGVVADAGAHDAAAVDAATHEGGAADAGGPWPQPDVNTVYMIYYPDSTTVTMGGGTSCNDFYGYHGDFALTGSTYVTYSVVSRCPPFPDTSAIDSLTSIASHELIEAATDPRANDDPAYLLPDTDHLAWAIPAGGELGDMCAGYGDVFYTPSDVPYLVQRTWSNEAAAAGHDPCQPDGADPYFNAAADLTDVLTVNDPTLGTYTSLGTTIPVGGTGTVKLQLYSDGPTGGPFSIQAYDLSSLFGGPQELDVTFAGQSTATGVNGDTVEMTIKVLSAGSGDAEILWIQSSLGQVQPVWLGLVQN